MGCGLWPLSAGCSSSPAAGVLSSLANPEAWWARYAPGPRHPPRFQRRGWRPSLVAATARHPSTTRWDARSPWGRGRWNLQARRKRRKLGRFSTVHSVPILWTRAVSPPPPANPEPASSPYRKDEGRGPSHPAGEGPGGHAGPSPPHCGGNEARRHPTPSLQSADRRGYVGRSR